MKKAVILARVSTAKQEEEGDNQLQTLHEYAQRNNFEVVKEFRFSETADNKIRTKFNEMLEFISQNKDIQIVITFRVDRITRNYRDAVLIDDLRLEHSKEIHFVHDRLVINKDTVGRDIVDWDLKVFLAKQYLNRLKEDAKNSALYMLKNGLWPQGAPFGYRNVTKEDKKKWIEIDDFEGNIVKKMYEWYSTSSYSLLEIRNKVKKELGRNLSKGMVDKVLKNPFYHGVMLYNGIEYEHRYSTLITKETFDKVQKIKAGFMKKPHKFAGLPFLYRGLISCSHCGCTITPEKKKGKYNYYHCTEYHGKHGALWLNEEEITDQLSQIFSSIKIPTKELSEITKTLRQAHSDKIAFQGSLRKELNQEYDKLENRLEKMYEDKLDGSITESEYAERCKKYRKRQAEILEQQKRIQEADEDYYLTSDYILQLCNRSGVLFKSSEMEERRQLIQLVVQNLSLNGRKLEYNLQKPFSERAYFTDRQLWLEPWNDFRTIDWVTEIPFPETTLKLTQELLYSVQ